MNKRTYVARLKKIYLQRATALEKNLKSYSRKIKRLRSRKRNNAIIITRQRQYLSEYEKQHRIIGSKFNKRLKNLIKMYSENE